MSAGGLNAGALLLRNQLQELERKPVEGFSAGLANDDNLFMWEVVVYGPEGTYYEEGQFKATLEFPKDYPVAPPTMKFVSDIWHPNGWHQLSMANLFVLVEKNGKVCISILHPPGDDPHGYERPEERWLPIHTVTTIIHSVISMLSDPNPESPANVDAAREYREDKTGAFKTKTAMFEVRQCVRKSLES